MPFQNLENLLVIQIHQPLRKALLGVSMQYLKVKIQYTVQIVTKMQKLRHNFIFQEEKYYFKTIFFITSLPKSSLIKSITFCLL